MTIDRKSASRTLREISRLLQSRFGVGRVFHSGLPPIGRFPLLPDPLRQFLGHRGERFDRELARIVGPDSGAFHVPLELGLDETHMATDGFHPGPMIYAGWADLLYRAILQEPASLGR